MATNKAKRSAHPTQLTSTTQGSPVLPRTRLIHFAQAKGKIVESVEFSASPDHHDLSIRFRDKTGFNFTIQAGFTLKTEYSNWKSGEQRILRVWPLFKS